MPKITGQRLTCARDGCENPPYKRNRFCYPHYRAAHYVQCSRCPNPCHKRSESGLCMGCYWEERRATSPLTGLTKQQYDAQRYDAARRRAHFLLKKYDLTAEAYNAMYDAQGGACAICRTPFAESHLTHGNPVVDHCHQTGTVRGLLCDLCNKGLGQFKDDLILVERAGQYLRESACRGTQSHGSPGSCSSSSSKAGPWSRKLRARR